LTPDGVGQESAKEQYGGQRSNCFGVLLIPHFIFKNLFTRLGVFLYFKLGVDYDILRLNAGGSGHWSH
jgi:hypothetical protein